MYQSKKCFTYCGDACTCQEQRTHPLGGLGIPILYTEGYIKEFLLDRLLQDNPSCEEWLTDAFEDFFRRKEDD